MPKEAWDSEEYNLLKSVGELQGKTTVVFDEDVTDDFLGRFYDQYKDAYTFQLILARDFPDEITTLGNTISNDTLQSLTKPIVLIDTAMNIRNYYDHSRESLTHLIEDVAMTIPRKPPIEIISQ